MINLPIFAVAQMNSQDSINQNLGDVSVLMMQAREKGACLLVLPENFACFAAGQQANTAARFDDIVQQLQQMAAKYGLWLVAGSIPCPYRPNGQPVTGGRVRSASLLISPDAKTVARYDKIHLFDAQVSDNIGTNTNSYQESATFEPGDEVVVASTPFGQLGMMVCYDLRFPELALLLRKKGADFLTAPSAFTYTTGQMHWQLLLRARAADTQCYVLGAAQQGMHGERQTWGHSAITNAAGDIVAERNSEDIGIITAEFDRNAVQQRRDSMPLIQHRRLGLLKDF